MSCTEIFEKCKQTAEFWPKMLKSVFWQFEDLHNGFQQSPAPQNDC